MARDCYRWCRGAHHRHRLLDLFGRRGKDDGMDAPSMFVELLLSGVVTALPLFFARAAARMALSTLGFVQYIGPTIMLLLSVFVFKESVSSVLLVGFALIWTALVARGIGSQH